MGETESIIKAPPINKTAALVTSGGIHYEPSRNISCDSSDMPIPTIKVPRAVKDYTGAKSGELTVVGLRRIKTNRNKVKVWVVRCSCGVYETRVTHSLRNINNNEDCCVKCRQTKYLRRTEYYNRTGTDRE